MSDSAPHIPRDKTFDSTYDLFQEGYDFIRNHCWQLGTDVFQTRIQLKPTICMMGREASLLFYDEQKFKRSGAAPKRVMKTLFGQQGVQGLDGQAHRHRKAMFMALMNEQSLEALLRITEASWLSAINDWQQHNKPVILKDAVADILTQSVCQWAGVPLEPDEIRHRSQQFLLMIEAAGQIGLPHWQGRQARRSMEKWCRQLIQQTRHGSLPVSDNTALFQIAHHRELDDSVLPEQIAAVELLNVLRPTVAITYYVVLTALALHQFPHEAQRLGDAESRHRFVQEVRRFYPFFPATMAQVRQTFEWQGYRFEEGHRVMLDLYGTNHDERLWQNPEQFWPDRFLDYKPDTFSLIPQGGGDYWQNHRCAGEWFTVSIMALMTKLLTTTIDYDVPGQNLLLAHNKMPAIPESGFIISQITLLATVTIAEA